MEIFEKMEDCKDTETLDVEQDQELLADELRESIVELTGPIYESVKDVSEPLISTDINLENKTMSEVIRAKIDSLPSPLEQWKKEKNEKISSLEKSYNEINVKWQIAETQREKDKAEIERLTSQTEKILEQFLGIADTTIAVFCKAYGDVLPPKSRDDYKFVRSLLGTLSNMSASGKGRQFLIENTSGKGLIKNLVAYTLRVPTPSGLAIKKLILLTLWNMCVNNNCLRYLFELQVGRVVVHCLDDSSAEEIKKLGLNILQSITYDLEPQLLDELIKNVPIEKIQQIAYDSQDKVADLAQRILDNLASHENQILGPSHQ